MLCVPVGRPLARFLFRNLRDSRPYLAKETNTRYQLPNAYSARVQREWDYRTGALKPGRMRATSLIWWFVERTLAWTHQFGRLRLRRDRLPSIHKAFMSIVCSLICMMFLA